MKVHFLYREQRQSGFSIEEVFNNIRNKLPLYIHQSEFKANPFKSYWSNLQNVKNFQSDIYHITGDCNYLTLGLPKHRTVLTVHDIGHYEVSLKGFKKMVYGIFWWKLPLAKTKVITSISNFTKNKLVSTFGVSPQKIRVIYNPVPPEFLPFKKDFNNQYPRILQIGSGRNKNVERLIEAVKGIPCKLVLINRLDNGLKELLAKHNIDYEQHEGLSKKQVYEQYINCDIVYFASTYEGFGLPIVEGQAVGRPVITSNICSMPEVAGNGAVLVDPFDVNSIRNSIHELIKSPDYVTQIIQSGFENVRRFDAKSIADQYYALYREVHERN